MNSFLVTLAIWGALFCAFWYALHDRYYPPGDWVGALVISFFIAIAIGSMRKARLEKRDAALLRHSDEAPRDGQRIALAGTIDLDGEPLHAPLSGDACVAYDYSIAHLRQSSGNSRAREVIDRSGIALAPATIRAGVRTIRLLAVPGLERFSETAGGESAQEHARAYLDATPFEDTTSLFAASEIGGIMNDRSGALRKDWKLTSHELDLPSARFKQRFVPPGEKVCLIGRYSAAEGAIVPEANAGGVRLIRGTRQEVLSFLDDSRLGDWIAAALLLIFPTIATLGILAYREHYFNANNQPSVRSARRDAFLAAATDGDVAAIQKTLARGVDVNSHDADGDTALMKVSDVHTAEALLAAGANVNARGHDGLTALILASAYGHPDIVRLLIRHGADLEAVDGVQRKTALGFALLNDQSETARILREAGAREPAQ